MPQSGARTGGHLFGLRLDDGPSPGVWLLRDGQGGRTFVVEVASLASSGLLDWVAASWTASPPSAAGPS